MQRLGCGAGFESAVRRLPDYEPDELPGCSTPRLNGEYAAASGERNCKNRSLT